MKSQDRLHLKWNDHSNCFLQAFFQYLVTDRMVDVTLSCQGKLIKAHKIILSASSSYFEDLFKLHKQNEVIIVLNSISARQLMLMIQYIYTGEIHIEEDDLYDFLLVAEQLQIKSLKDVLSKLNYKGTNCLLNNAASGDVVAEEKLTNVDAENTHNFINDEEPSSPPDSTSTSTDMLEPQEQNNNTMHLEDAPMFRTQMSIKKTPKIRIRRAPNAFMIFSNQWRKKLANEHKEESNKNISVRLGLMWKSLDQDEKAKYYLEAKNMVEEYKLKHPDADHSNEGRKRKKRKREVLQKQINISSDLETPMKLEKLSSGYTENDCESTESADKIKVDPQPDFQPELSDVINAIIGKGVTNCIIENNNIVTRAEIEPALFVKEEILQDDDSD
ncbi:transcription factor Sox-13-like [Ctenocephalides felis]|uniref:transcription factor Sox-13-like n=1 Tax=Ctenocephalides felis TaxID=7515 RepID=UPI000E6E1DB7|nr:transcription factor Sox-13-like [Ctenocephalides felis]